MPNLKKQYQALAQAVEELGHARTSIENVAPLLDSIYWLLDELLSSWNSLTALAPDGWPLEPRAFGLAVLNARGSAGFTQATLARTSGLSELTIRNVEQCRKPMKPSTRRYLIGALEKLGQPTPPPNF